MSVLVIGAGLAGSSAAIAAARAGARVTVIDGGTGASTLWTGAIDVPASNLPAEARSLAEELGAVVRECTLVTSNGYVREAAGRDAALLDIGGSASGPIAIVGASRPAWDATGVARAAGAGFLPLEAAIVRHDDEHILGDADFAARHDDDQRLGWLAERLLDALRRTGVAPRAIILPPCLGIRRSRARDLSVLVGLPCGEVMGLPGGPCGLRFEAARDAAFTKAGVAVVCGRASGLVSEGHGFSVNVDGTVMSANAVIVAAGGLIGGGLEYQPSDAIFASALPPEARPSFACSIAGPFIVGLDGEPLDAPRSLFGTAPEEVAWPLAARPLMDRVGLLCDRGGRIGRGLYAAGEIVANVPRTWLQALASGVQAGEHAARDATASVSSESPSAVSAAFANQS